MPVDKWDSRKVVKLTQAHLKKNMKAAMLILQGEVQRRLSIGADVVRSGKVLRATKPAEDAPTAPRKVTGRLNTSITHRVSIDGRNVIGVVGTNVPYARRLELGFSGTDSKGRNINQGARPFLRPALKEFFPRLVAILSRG